MGKKPLVEKPAGSKRYLAVDALRGSIMVLMALDHANHFVAQQHPVGEHWGGLFPVYEMPLPFITRIVTHLAAPGFFFLMGVGMTIFAKSRMKVGWNQWQIIRYFLIRGAFFILIQFTIINRAWQFSPGGWDVQIYLGVLNALGMAMIIASLLVWLSPRVLIGLTLLLFVGTELLHPDPGLWEYLTPGPLGLFLLYSGGDIRFWSNYPILPWLELVTFGLVFGQWLGKSEAKTTRLGFWLGLMFLFGFFFLRYLDGFGNIRPRAGDGWIDFFNLVKYPPSMVFTLLTTGINLILLRLFYLINIRRLVTLYPLVVFGRAPLVFYIAHLFLYAGLGYILSPNGTSIPRMLPVWLLGLLILFPICAWFGSFKRKQPLESFWRFM